MRDKLLLGLRPEVYSITIENQTSENERFQNLTLRPILKFQNEMIIRFFKTYIEKRKGVFRQLSDSEQLAYIDDHLKKDKELSAKYIGLVLSCATLEEYDIYLRNKSEINRRIRTLIIQRLQSQKEVL